MNQSANSISKKTTLLGCDDAWDQFLDDNYDECISQCGEDLVLRDARY